MFDFTVADLPAHSPADLLVGAMIGAVAWAVVVYANRRSMGAAPLRLIDVAALAAALISSSSSASVMWGVFANADPLLRITFTGATGALVGMALVLFREGLVLLPLSIWCVSTITSATAFGAVLNTAQKAESRLQAVETEASEDRSDWRDRLALQRQTVAALQRSVEAQADRIAAAAETTRAQATGAGAAVADKARADQLRAELARLQAVRDCELDGSAARPGCVGDDGRPVTDAGQGPRYDRAAAKAAAAKAQLDALEARLAAELAAADRSQDAAKRADARLAELEAKLGEAEATLAELERTGDGRENASEAVHWAVAVWDAFVALTVNSPPARWIGATEELVKLCAAVILAAQFDWVSSLYKRERPAERERQAVRWPGLRRARRYAVAWLVDGPVAAANYLVESEPARIVRAEPRVIPLGDPSEAASGAPTTESEAPAQSAARLGLVRRLILSLRGGSMVDPVDVASAALDGADSAPQDDAPQTAPPAAAPTLDDRAALLALQTASVEPEPDWLAIWREQERRENATRAPSNGGDAYRLRHPSPDDGIAARALQAAQHVDWLNVAFVAAQSGERSEDQSSPPAPPATRSDLFDLGALPIGNCQVDLSASPRVIDTAGWDSRARLEAAAKARRASDAHPSHLVLRNGKLDAEDFAGDALDQIEQAKARKVDRSAQQIGLANRLVGHGVDRSDANRLAAEALRAAEATGLEIAPDHLPTLLAGVKAGRPTADVVGELAHQTPRAASA